MPTQRRRVSPEVKKAARKLIRAAAKPSVTIKRSGGGWNINVGRSKINTATLSLIRVTEWFEKGIAFQNLAYNITVRFNLPDLHKETVKAYVDAFYSAVGKRFNCVNKKNPRLAMGDKRDSRKTYDRKSDIIAEIRRQLIKKSFPRKIQ